MGVLADVGRYAAFAALLSGTLRLSAKLGTWQQHEYVSRRRRWVQLLVAFLQSAIMWVGLVVTIAPITGVLNASLLASLLLIPLVQVTLGVALAKALRVRIGGKTSVVTASELTAVEHQWLQRMVMRSHMLFLALLAASGAVALILGGDRETTMFRFAFGLLFLSALPTSVWRALLMMSPVLDDNARDGELASGMTALISQVLALGLLLSSIDLPRTEIPLGVAGASLTVSLPILAVVLAYFVLATGIPYAVGVRRAARLHDRLRTEEEAIRDSLAKLLMLPKADLYPAALTEIRDSVDAALQRLKGDYFYLSLRRPSPEATTAAIAQAIEAGELHAAHAPPRGTDWPDVSEVLQDAVEDGHGEDEGEAGPSVIEGTVVGEEPAESVALVATEQAPPDEAESEMSYGELAESVAKRYGWKEGDPRRTALDTMVHSFEHEARRVDPAIRHCGWLERLRGLIEEIESDLAGRTTRTEKETAAHHWSSVAEKQDMEFAQRGRGAGRPQAVVVLTAVGGLVVSGLARAAATEVWTSFNGG